MITQTIAPRRPDVQLQLSAGPQDDLTLIGRVVDALDRAGHTGTADVFTKLAHQCETSDDLLLLISCTVTVL